jgi:hypothetical protein
MLIDTHQLINGTHPNSVEIDTDGSVYYDV